MITLALEAEKEHPLGCRYLVQDALTMEKTGTYDLVTSVFLLNYARNKQELIRMLLAVSKNLVPGGRYVGLNDNIFQKLSSPPATYLEAFEEAGFTTITWHPLVLRPQADKEQAGGDTHPLNALQSCS